MDPQPSHLQRLNPEQHRAVTTIDGPLLILAGAGSGKTRVLTRRIAHLLHRGVSPKNILAVTFTKKAAAEMKERVIELVGEAGEQVWMSTFHSTCCRILRIDIEALGFTKRFAIYDDDDQLRIIKHIITDLNFDPKRVEPKSILSRIDWYKNRMKTPDRLVSERRAHDNEPLIQVWRQYEQALIASDALDFNDLISATVTLLKEHEEICEKWQSRFLYILVDEYQDTNHGQYELLRILAEGHHNLAVVGDDDQSIYGFRGADISNILGFEKDYPNATVVRLEQNYRCSGNILAIANRVVAVNPGRKPKKLWTEASDGAKVTFIQARTMRGEGRRVARGIYQLRKNGREFGDMAIIYRTNATARYFESALNELSIPYQVVGGRRLYERREVRDILAYLRLISNPSDDAALLRIANVPPRGIGPKTISTLREDAAKRGEPLLRSLRGLATQNNRSGKALRNLLVVVDELTDVARDLHLHIFLETLIERTGYQAMLAADLDDEKRSKVAQDARVRLKNLQHFVEDARLFELALEESLSPAEMLRAFLDRIVLASQTEEIPEGGQVTLMTAHNAKGLEYPVVFVVQMMEGCFPHAKSEESGIEEERRLAYVAFTRAMERLVVSRSQTASDFGSKRQRPATPSRFLYGLPTEACDGQPPSGEPTSPESTPRSLSEQNQQKLRDFLHQRRKDRQQHLTPTDEYSLIDVEEASQLRVNAKVYHQRHGFGIIRARQQHQVKVEFGTGSVVSILIDHEPLQLVRE
ncbi:MAG: UvrD-helicase domain-containing protein [Proteobacteria bacterium]|jgi:DNA helicase II / ATP-dependent DNA helicase PcrA|nr:UvrD-helicase domain-containing protein [Pseudomonadota bacterium]